MTGCKPALIIAAASVALVVGGVSSSWACACCADHGHRSEQTDRISDFDRELLAQLKFSGNGTLYLTAAGFEDIRGISNPVEAEQYRMTVAKGRARWVFSFDDGKGHNGSLVMELPDRIHTRSIDTKPQRLATDKVRKVLLYKELILDTRISGTGIFKNADRTPSKARLIFHGEGNSCTFAEQFTNWTLDIADKGTRFRFFGRLQRTTSQNLRK